MLISMMTCNASNTLTGLTAIKKLALMLDTDVELARRPSLFKVISSTEIEFKRLKMVQPNNT